MLSQADFGSAPDDEASAVFSSDSAVSHCQPRASLPFTAPIALARCSQCPPSAPTSITYTHMVPLKPLTELVLLTSCAQVAAEISQRAARRDQLSAHHAELHAVQFCPLSFSGRHIVAAALVGRSVPHDQNVASLETELEQLRTEKFR